MRKPSLSDTLVRDRKVEIFSKKKGWYLPKRKTKKRDNTVAILRDILILTEYYPIEQKERIIWDKTFGDLYLYSEEKIGVVILDERMRRLG